MNEGVGLSLLRNQANGGACCLDPFGHQSLTSSLTLRPTVATAHR